MVTTGVSSCLLCTQPGLVTDWSPVQDWLAVEGCRCGGFFAWKGVWGERVLRLRVPARRELAARIRALVAAGREAWLATADGTATGPLYVHARRLEMPPLPSAPVWICRLCSKPIPSNSLVFFEQGELSHIPCRSRLLTLQVLEQFDRAHVTRTRTETTIARTPRMVEKAKQRQQRSPWNDPPRKS
jgi:hypothetical protein